MPGTGAMTSLAWGWPAESQTPASAGAAMPGWASGWGAGLAAPSGCNKQTTSLIAVDDPELLDRLHAVIQPAAGETAPAMICVLTRRVFAYRDRCFATQDYSAAIENMLLAIAALGYQSCWYEGHITDTDRIGDQMARILGVPEGYELVCFLPVGIPEDEPVQPKKRPFEERAWFNGYHAC